MKQIANIFLVTLMLYGCSKTEVKSQPTANGGVATLTSVDQVASWAESVKSSAQLSVKQIDDVKSTEMLNVQVLPIEHDVFFLERAPRLDGTKSKTGLNTVLPVKDWRELYQQLSDTNYGKSMNSSIIVAPEKLQKKAEDLSQAGLAQFKYAGSLSFNGTNVGLLKVDDRLYRVHVGDAIGSGHWPIINIEPQKMQLKVAGKTISYERN